MSAGLITPPTVGQQKRPRTDDFYSPLQNLIQPEAFGKLTLALKRAQYDPQVNVPEAEVIDLMDLQISNQYLKLERVESILSEATDAIFELHSTARSRGETWKTCYDSTHGLQFEVDETNTNRVFYRNCLGDVESCYHSIKLFRDSLRFQMSLHETMRAVQTRRELESEASRTLYSQQD